VNKGDPSGSGASEFIATAALVGEPWVPTPGGPQAMAYKAREVGLSRSALADRFTRLIGEPPMRYLARWRLQLAAQQLRGTNATLARIVKQVGYESEAAFNRAFKRTFGIPPATWRKSLSRPQTTFREAT
jgi:transcriptional regulator GlxA family with amidase domain